MQPAGICYGVLIFQTNFSLRLLPQRQMELCLQAAPKAEERFMPSMRRVDKSFGQCRWITLIPAHQRLPEELFTFLMHAHRHMLLTPQTVSNYGITQALVQMAVKEAVARRPSYILGYYTSVILCVRT